MSASLLEACDELTLKYHFEGSRLMSEKEVRSTEWFPSGIATEVTSLDDAPNGFSAWRISTSWGTFDALHLEDSEAALKGDIWGILPEKRRIIHLPFNSKIENSQQLPQEKPCGGIKYQDRDLLLFFEGESRGHSLLSGFQESPIETASALGTSLGKSAALMMQKVSMNNDQENWNARLKVIEDRLKTETLWRASHAPETRGSITYRHLRPEHIRIENGEIIFEGVWGGIESVILEMTDYRPAISDLGAAIALLYEYCRDSFDDALHALLASWRSHAPASLHNKRAVDAHRGGLHIWVYEAMLNRMLMARAMGDKEPLFVRKYLGEVSHLQAGMFRARSWSALSLLCYASGGVVLGAYLWDYLSSSNLLLFPAFLLGGWWFERMYRNQAPSYW